MRTLVFCYYTYDRDSGRPVHSKRAATLEAIERENGVPMRETGIEVDAGEIDGRGYLKGAAGCEHPIYRRLDPAAG